MSDHGPGWSIGAVAWAVLRYGYAAWFLFFALFMMIGFGGHVPGSIGPDADPFLKAMKDEEFIEPLLIVVYLAGGGALLIRRFAPLGIVLLAGPVTMIFGFHLFHTHLFVWGGIWAVGLVALAWHFQDRFAMLVYDRIERTARQDRSG